MEAYSFFAGYVTTPGLFRGIVYSNVHSVSQHLRCVQPCCRAFCDGRNCALSAPVFYVFSIMHRFLTIARVLLNLRWVPDVSLWTSTNKCDTYTLSTANWMVTSFPLTFSCTLFKIFHFQWSHWAYIAFKAGLSGDASSHPGSGLLSSFHRSKEPMSLCSCCWDFRIFFNCPFSASLDDDCPRIDRVLSFVHTLAIFALTTGQSFGVVVKSSWTMLHIKMVQLLLGSVACGKCHPTVRLKVV